MFATFRRLPTYFCCMHQLTIVLCCTHKSITTCWNSLGRRIPTYWNSPALIQDISLTSMSLCYEFWLYVHLSYKKQAEMSCRNSFTPFCTSIHIVSSTWVSPWGLVFRGKSVQFLNSHVLETNVKHTVIRRVGQVTD